MRKLLSLITLAALCAAVATMGSCKPKANQVEAIAIATPTGQADVAFPATSVGVKLNLASIESYVYAVEEGANCPPIDPMVLYAEATEKFVGKDGEHNLFIYNVEGAKTYTIHFAFKVAGENRYISQSISSKTPAYTQLINVVGTDHFSLKVQFNVAAGEYFRYVIKPRSEYYDQKVGFGTSDLALLDDGILKQGPQVISYVDGGPTGFIDPETGEPALALVKPNMAYVVLFARCDESGKIRSEKTGGVATAPQYSWSHKPFAEGYTETCTDEGYKLLDPYARTYIASAASIVGVGEFSVDRKSLTERNVEFRVTPPESVVNYGAVIMTIGDYENQKIAVGQNGLYGLIQGNSTPIVGAKDVKNNKELLTDTTYYLVIIGNCDLNGKTQIHKVVEFKPIVSDKPVATLEITPMPDASQPYQITYNIKAPDKNCTSAKYLLNYTKLWVPDLNSGSTYQSMVSAFGVPFKAAELNLINSAEGYKISFDSWEDIESILAINSYNADEKAATFHKEIRSGKEQAKARVESPLFNSLLGQWDVAFSYVYADNDKDLLQASFKSNIAGGPAEADPTFGPSHPSYDHMFKAYIEFAKQNGIPEAERKKWATDNIAADVLNYKESSTRYATKYREQNRLLMTNFYFASDNALEYFSPWDLFCSPFYSSYDVDQLFHDFGPKLFFEIRKNGGADVVTLETNPQFIAPFSSYDNYILRTVVGYKEGAIYRDAFPIEIVDANTIKIKHLATFQGDQYPLTLLDNGQSLYIIVKSDITLTRSTAPAAMKAPLNIYNGVSNGATTINGRGKRSAIPLMHPALQPQKPIEIEVFDRFSKSRR